MSRNLSDEARFLQEAEAGEALFPSTSGEISLHNEADLRMLLKIICYENNFHKIAYALAVHFHGNENIPLRVKKGKGYAHLMNIVEAIVRILRFQNAPLPVTYCRFARKLFEFKGAKVP